MRNRSENQITLVLIRHGAARENKEQRYLGKTDASLSDEGERELSAYRNAGFYPSVDYVFTSPMKRCIRTAQILYPYRRPFVIEEWKEMDFGVFEGKNHMELKDDKRYQAWIDSNGSLPFPEGESREDFILRCEKGFQRMRRELGDIRRATTAGMIVHGGTIMALLSSCGSGAYFDYQAPNGKGYMCTCTWKGRNGSAELSELKKLPIPDPSHVLWPGDI